MWAIRGAAAAVTAAARRTTTATKSAGPKPFEAMPGPRSLPVVGTLLDYRGRKRKYDLDHLDANGLSKFREFGPIVREEILPGVHLVWLFDPEDIKVMYQREGRFPSRRSHLALEKYRLDRPDLYNNGGLLPTNGPEWHRIRSQAQRPLGAAAVDANFLRGIDAVSRDFVAALMAAGSTADFLAEAEKYFLEVTGMVTFGTRLGALEKDLGPDSLPARVIAAAYQTNSSILGTDNGLPLWRWFETRDFRRLRAGQELIYEVTARFIDEVTVSRGQGGCRPRPRSLLDFYLDNPDLDRKDVHTLVADTLLAGIDTTSYTTTFLMYQLAKHPEEQAALRASLEEAVDHHEDGEGLAEALERFHYGKLVLKESLRLHPVSVGVSRILDEDTVLSGYLVPKGSILVTQNQVSCRLAEYCGGEDPEKFLPRRWERRKEPGKCSGNGGGPNSRLHTHLSLPFGFGPRSCIGRRLAERTICNLMYRLFKENVVVTTTTSDLGCVSKLINRPDRPLQITVRRG